MDQSKETAREKAISEREHWEEMRVSEAIDLVQALVRHGTPEVEGQCFFCNSNISFGDGPHKYDCLYVRAVDWYKKILTPDVGYPKPE